MEGQWSKLRVNRAQRLSTSMMRRKNFWIRLQNPEKLFTAVMTPLVREMSWKVQNCSQMRTHNQDSYQPDPPPCWAPQLTSLETLSILKTNALSLPPVHRRNIPSLACSDHSTAEVPAKVLTPCKIFWTRVTTSAQSKEAVVRIPPAPHREQRTPIPALPSWEIAKSRGYDETHWNWSGSTASKIVPFPAARPFPRHQSERWWSLRQRRRIPNKTSLWRSIRPSRPWWKGNQKQRSISTVQTRNW